MQAFFKQFDPRLLALFAAAIIFYGANVDFMALGDVYYYANIIDARGFHDHTLHQGYYFVSLFTFQFFSLFSSELTLPQSMGYMNAIFGAGILVVSWRLAGHFVERSSEQWLLVFCLLISYRLWSNATVAEVYTLQTFLVLLSFNFFVRGQFFATGLAFAFAAWVTPLSAFSALFFPAFAYARGYPLVPSLSKSALPVIVLYGLFLALFYEELFWGSRGLFVVHEKIPFDVDQGIRSFGLYMFKHYNFLLLLWLPAIYAFKEHKTLLVVTLCTVIPNFYVISKLTGEDNTFILVLDFFFAIWMVKGWIVLSRWARNKAYLKLAGIACFVSSAGIFLYTQTPFANCEHREYEHQMRAVAERINNEDKYLLTNWANAMAIVYYGRETPVVPFEQGELYDRIFEEIKISETDKDFFSSVDYLYAQETFGTSSLFELYQSEEASKQKYQQHSSILEFEYKFNLSCQPFSQELVPLYKCSPKSLLGTSD